MLFNNPLPPDCTPTSKLQSIGHQHKSSQLISLIESVEVVFVEVELSVILLAVELSVMFELEVELSKIPDPEPEAPVDPLPIPDELLSEPLPFPAIPELPESVVSLFPDEDPDPIPLPIELLLLLPIPLPIPLPMVVFLFPRSPPVLFLLPVSPPVLFLLHKKLVHSESVELSDDEFIEAPDEAPDDPEALEFIPLLLPLSLPLPEVTLSLPGIIEVVELSADTPPTFELVLLSTVAFVALVWF